jgi:hypothetical protein
METVLHSNWYDGSVIVHLKRARFVAMGRLQVLGTARVCLEAPS